MHFQRLMPTRARFGIGEPIRPVPVVPIALRRHIPTNRIPTRVGIGENLIDYAAGLPRRTRASGAQLRPVAPVSDIATSGITRRFSEPSFPADDSPVVLPLRRDDRVLIVIATALTVLIAVIAVSLVIAGTRNTLEPPTGRVDAVVPRVVEKAPLSEPQVPAAEPSRPAPIPSARVTRWRGERPVAGAPKRPAQEPEPSSTHTP
jgi:hypothetical protein